jgi:hypothetical protein
MNCIKACLHFLIHPTPSKSRTFPVTIISFIYLFVFTFLIDFVLDWLTSNQSVFALFGINKAETQDNDIFNRGIVYGVFIVGLLTPAIEELLQRSYLTSFYWNHFLIPVNLGIIIVMLLGIHGNAILLPFGIISLISALTIYLMIKKNRAFKLKTFLFYRRNYWLYFYISAFSFGLLHLMGYKMHHFIPVVSMLLVLPQIFAGCVLGFVRIKFGLKWSIGFHMLHNLILIIFLFFGWK